MARFNLSWVLGGELTGDGDLPDFKLIKERTGTEDRESGCGM
jgi:hypothetical protein